MSGSYIVKDHEVWTFNDFTQQPNFYAMLFWSLSSDM